MPTQLHSNNENDVPATHVNRLKRGLSSNIPGDPVRAEKRARGLGLGSSQLHKSTSSSTTSFKSLSTSTSSSFRRAVLGDVTNRVTKGSSSSSISNNNKNNDSDSTGVFFQPKKKLVTQSHKSLSHSLSHKSSSHGHLSTSAGINIKREPRVKREPVATTPMAHTFDSLELSSPLCVPPTLNDLSPIQEYTDPRLHDIDTEDKHDASACWQYAEDVTNYYLEIEKKRMPSSSYMTRQSDINSKMRAILVDWLVDVHTKYKLSPQTLHIAVHLIDRHLERDFSVARNRLQLVGVAALFVAAKYEEIYPPEANDFVKITDNAYTREELFAMEIDILTSVGYRVTFPTALQFMKRFVKASRTCDDRVEYFAHYVIDRTLQEYKMIKYSPSRIAASAVYIARTQMNDLPAWNSTMQHHTSYDEMHLLDCLEDIKQMLWNTHHGAGKTSKLSAVRRKFEKEQYMGVAALPLLFDETT